MNPGLVFPNVPGDDSRHSVACLRRDPAAVRAVGDEPLPVPAELSAR